MQGASLVLTSYQDSLRRAMDIVANNVANVSTTGYKRENIAFDTFLSQPTPKDSFQFAVDDGTYRDPAQGATQMTGNTLDVAIQGDGYFTIQTPSGIRYTRAGGFMLNGEGELVTPAGFQVLADGDQSITFPEDARDIGIASDGTITATTGNGAISEVGKLALANFEDEQSLLPVGDSLYLATQAPNTESGGTVVQGAVEQSNVKSVEEMTRMIDVSRTYQMVVRLMEKENKRMTDAIQRLGKVSA